MDAQQYRNLPYLALAGEVSLAELSALAEQYPYAEAIWVARAVAAQRTAAPDAALIVSDALARIADKAALHALLAQLANQTIVSEAQPEAVQSQTDLIDSFLQIAPTFNRASTKDTFKESPATQSSSAKADENAQPAIPIQTEAMAAIYLKQGQAARAAEIYAALIAQNPARSAYFADLLRKTGQTLPEGYGAEELDYPSVAQPPTKRKTKRRLFRFMIIAIVSLIVMVALLLILIVLAQDSKTGGFTTGFAGSQLMGVQKTTDLLERLTWGLGVALFVLAISTSFMVDRGEAAGPNTVNIERARQSGGAVAPAPAQKPANQQAPAGKDTGK